MADVKSPATALRVYEQIEQTAGFYEPAVYDLLTFQGSLKTEADSLASQFIPFGTVKPRRASDAIPFVIGLIPPSANVTGRLLDRSASVAAIQGYAEGPADVSGGPAPGVNTSYKAPGDKGSTRDPIVTMPGYQMDVVGTPFSPGTKYTTAGTSEPDPTLTKLSNLQVYQAIYDAYTRKFGHPPSATECAIYTAQSMRETSGNWYNNNPGYIGNYPSYTEGTFKEKSDGHYYKTYPSVEAGADAFVAHVTRSQNAVQSAQSGDVLGYLTSQAQNGYYGDTIQHYYQPFPDLLRTVTGQLRGAGGPVMNTGGLAKSLPGTCGLTEDIYAYRKRVNYGAKGNKVDGYRAQANSNYDGCPLLPPGTSTGDGTSPGWSTTGSANAQEGQKALSAKANRDLNQTELGQALAGQQRATIRALQIALQQMASTPPLRMMVNPSSFKVAEEKIASDGNWGRSGPIVQHWGEGQATITASGRVAGFFAMDTGTSSATTPGVSPGLTRMARNFSASYQNFLSLYLLYKNNGAIWLEDFASPGNKPANLALMGSVYLYYDHTLYVGSFDSFSVTETDDKPFSLDYDMQFTARSIFVLDAVADPRLNYGDPTLFAQPGVIPTASAQAPGTPTMSQADFDATVARIQRDGELAALDPIQNFVGPPISDDDVARQIGLKPLGKNATFAPRKK